MRFLLIFLLLYIGCDKDPLSPEALYGCTNQDACNFNPNATIFDDTCIYAQENYDCQAGDLGTIKTHWVTPEFRVSELELEPSAEAELGEAIFQVRSLEGTRGLLKQR